MKIRYLIFFTVIISFFVINNVWAVENETNNQTANNQEQTKHQISNIADQIANFLSDKNIDRPIDLIISSENSVFDRENINNQETEEVFVSGDYQLNGQNNLIAQSPASIHYQKFIGDRRSEIMSIVQNTLAQVDNYPEIIQQAREITRNHIDNHENLAGHLARIQNQNRFIRFIFGPEPQAVSAARQILQENKQYLNELENLKNNLDSDDVKEVISQTVTKVQEIEEDLAAIVNDSTKKFSLFGWLINLMSSKK